MIHSVNSGPRLATIRSYSVEPLFIIPETKQLTNSDQLDKYLTMKGGVIGES